MRDTCIVIAIEEMPDEGLDQPLRLDKLANEVGTLGLPSVICCRCSAQWKVLSWMIHMYNSSSGVLALGDIERLFRIGSKRSVVEAADSAACIIWASSTDLSNIEIVEASGSCYR